MEPEMGYCKKKKLKPKTQKKENWENQAVEQKEMHDEKFTWYLSWFLLPALLIFHSCTRNPGHKLQDTFSQSHVTSLDVCFEVRCMFIVLVKLHCLDKVELYVLATSL